jgi:uncharacterized protein
VKREPASFECVQSNGVQNMHRRQFLGGLACLIAAPAAAQTPQSKLYSRSARALIAAARAQVGVTLVYDPAYTQIAFPGGDVARGKGVCTDVLIRAYRDAFGVDLQALVNADMRANFAAYPTRWGLTQADSNIDHRRVLNLATYFTRHGGKQSLPAAPHDWRPGDIFTSMVDGARPHIGIVSDKTSSSAPLILHNVGAGAREDDALLAYPLTGRYRWSLDT